jgi:trk system potassium uptake protein TrkA
VGLGNFGRSLAVKLGRAGIEVIAVDANLDRVDDVKNEVALAVRLDPTDENDLKSQGIHQVDMLVAAIEDNFESNQLLVVLSKRLGVRKVLALANSPTHARILRLIGADEVILPFEEAADRLFMRVLQPHLRTTVELAPGFTVAEVLVPKAFAGRPIKELAIRTKFGVTVTAILKKGYRRDSPDRNHINPAPGPEDVLEAGDTMVVVGLDTNIQRFVNEI